MCSRIITDGEKNNYNNFQYVMKAFLYGEETASNWRLNYLSFVDELLMAVK